jgi:hypothetical protein
VGYTEGFLDGLRRAGGSSADAVIDDLARAEQVLAVSGVLRSLTYNAQPVPAELPELHRRWTASGVFLQIDPELIEIAHAQRAS